MQKIKSYIKENEILLFILLCTILIIGAIFIRLININYESSDYTIYLIRWWNAIKELGIKEGLKANIGNYTEFYKVVLAIGTLFTNNALWYIKFSTMIFEILFAFVIYLFAKNIFHKGKKTSVLIALCSLFIPTVIANGAIAAQCDIIFTTMACFMIYFMLTEKYKTSMIFFGIAFAIKLQAIFIAPIILYLIINKKIKIRYLLLIPIPYLIFGLPALIAGKDIMEILTVYINQADGYSYWTLNAPNVYQIGELNLVDIPKLANWITIGVTGLVVLLTFIIFRKKYSKNLVLMLSLFFALIIPYLLPRMHERYMFMADIFSFIYVLAFGIKFLPIHLCIGVASFFSYFDFMKGFYMNTFGPTVLDIFNLHVLALFNMLAVVIIVFKLALEYRKESIKRRSEEEN